MTPERGPWNESAMNTLEVYFERIGVRTVFTSPLEKVVVVGPPRLSIRQPSKANTQICRSVKAPWF